MSFGRRHGRFGRDVRSRLQHRIFVWFGATILVTGVTVMLVTSLLGNPGAASSRHEIDRMRGFVLRRFERVWDDPAARDDLASAIARDLDADVVLTDPDHKPIASFGAPCKRPALDAPVERDRKTLGFVLVCIDRHGARPGIRAILALLVAGGMIWAASGKIARFLARPLAELTRVAREIGSGNLTSRMRLRRGDHGEVGVLAEAVNDMAARIERQLADQRELLAAVSHEIRTPLGRLRVLVELLRESGGDPKMVAQVDREVLEIDALVGELLASSRLDFAALAVRELDAAVLAKESLERAGLDPSVLDVRAADTKFQGDPTLVLRALANLVENAKKHAGGVVALVVDAKPGLVVFEVHDAGPGFSGDEERAFESFYRGSDGAGRDPSSLGLGLALVRRIAEAHRGRAYAANRPGGGARVGIELSTEAAPRARA